MATGQVPLQPGLIYGPIASKRLGRSLGINLSGSKRKLCNFNCIYCFYGPTVKPPNAEEYPAVEDVITAVTGALISNIEADWLTFSGNGESTFHPSFAEIVNRVRGVVDEIRPGLKIALLSNGSNVCNVRIRETLDLIDLPVLKLDVGDQSSYKLVNRPVLAPFSFDEIIDGFHSFARKKELTMQTVMFAGNPSNSDGQALDSWLKAISFIKPHTLQLYSIDYQIGSIYPVESRKLEQIARGVEELGVHVTVFSVLR